MCRSLPTLLLNGFTCLLIVAVSLTTVSTATSAAAATFAAATGSRNGGSGHTLAPYDDFHYPSEEPAEAAAAIYPSVTRVGSSSADFVYNNNGTNTTAKNVKVGDSVGPWRVVALVPLNAYAVVEREWQRWGTIAYVYVGGSGNSLSKGNTKSASPTASGRRTLLRKSVGALSGIRQPYFNFTGTDPDYFSRIEAGLDDVAATAAAAFTQDGEPDYASLAATLAPQRDINEIANREDVVKFVVTYNGRIKSGSQGITEYVDQHAPPPNEQKIIFDPGQHLSFWPSRFENSKSGLLGGYMRMANVGAFSPSVGKGYELVAFSPVMPGVTTSENDGDRSVEAPSPPPCAYAGPFNNTYVPNYPSEGAKSFATLAEAEAACDADLDCTGLTIGRGHGYQPRAGNSTLPSPFKETSWLISNLAACKVLPTLAGINYSPAVYVRLREVNASTGPGGSIPLYYRADNSSLTPLPVATFYDAMLNYTQRYTSMFSTAMRVRLPNHDRRQHDMALSALQSSVSNFVGLQPNYGNGATYWSYGKTDNGSLPFNILTVGDALLDWNLCDLALRVVGFYFQNYITNNGAINYYTWGNDGDSVGDLGRLAQLYTKTVSYCAAPSSWQSAHQPIVEALGVHMHSLWAAAAARKVSRPGCEGLLVGPPEHDWAGDTTDYFYNNNVWHMRGMDVLGTFLKTHGNATLGAQLLTGSVALRAAVLTSVQKCVVKNDYNNSTSGSGSVSSSSSSSSSSPSSSFSTQQQSTLTIKRGGGQQQKEFKRKHHQSPPSLFLPPAAAIGAKAYATMTESRAASYANFRFWSETLLADVLPRDIENSFLSYHNQLGGRAGGASRFEGWLDDMPTTGWGYGALTNNRTRDFQALLYGHAATYQSRGTFHTTEQLAWKGEGWYRDFLHWPNPSPNGTNASVIIKSTTATSTGATTAAADSDVATAAAPKGIHGNYKYYAQENDVSFCIVSQILIARLTRWQLVFDDAYRSGGSSSSDNTAASVWLARGAPRRWYLKNAGGFGVENAPTYHGAVSFTVTPDQQVPNKATFELVPPTAAVSNGIVFRLRWPSQLVGDAPACSHACRIVDLDSASGTVAIVATIAGKCLVTATFSA